MKKMANQHRVSLYVILLLAGLGVIFSIFQGNYELFTPIIIVGIVFLLLKFPPRRFRRTPKVKPSSRTQAKMTKTQRPKRKDVPFRVIQGNKGKNDSDDQMPRFH